MLFRKRNGELVEINKHNYKNDKIYYQTIMELKKMFLQQQQQKQNA